MRLIFIFRRRLVPHTHRGEYNLYFIYDIYFAKNIELERTLSETLHAWASLICTVLFSKGIMVTAFPVFAHQLCIRYIADSINKTDTHGIIQFVQEVWNKFLFQTMSRLRSGDLGGDSYVPRHPIHLTGNIYRYGKWKFEHRINGACNRQE